LRDAILFGFPNKTLVNNPKINPRCFEENPRFQRDQVSVFGKPNKIGLATVNAMLSVAETLPAGSGFG